MTSARMRTLIAIVVALAGLVAGSIVGAPRAVAAGNAVPNYEVKLNLTSAALDASNGPTSAVRSALGLGSSSTGSAYEYFDTGSLALNGEGWSVRLRHEQGEDLDLNYKRRFAVTGGNIDGALTTANRAGFDKSDDNYDAQVDWTYDKQTLSFANKKDSSSTGLSGTSLPSESDAVDLVVDKSPGKLEDTRSKGWGKDTLKGSRAHGPVTSRNWKGTWRGTKVDLEVLPVRAASGSGTETIVEFSFKADTLAEATALRAAAITELDAKGWLLKRGVLKTSLILDRY
ncbi:hypothetical protein [Gordonia zhenghanii]|uniref:hypothetical protein n=1 Tax=Gordonia zhenghanii TaxID=2911516 RepID=UPI001F400FF8|nr:hypothetical protein [Gordonia zhenghanii]